MVTTISKLVILILLALGAFAPMTLAAEKYGSVTIVVRDEYKNCISNAVVCVQKDNFFKVDDSAGANNTSTNVYSKYKGKDLIVYNQDRKYFSGPGNTYTGPVTYISTTGTNGAVRFRALEQGRQHITVIHPDYYGSYPTNEYSKIRSSRVTYDTVLVGGEETQRTVYMRTTPTGGKTGYTAPKEIYEPSGTPKVNVLYEGKPQ